MAKAKAPDFPEITDAPPRRAPRPWTSEDQARLEQLRAENASIKTIAAELDRSTNLIRQKMAKAGLSADRNGQLAQASARLIDAKTRRRLLAERMLGHAEGVMGRLEKANFQTILKGTFGVEEPRSLDFIPSRDERDMMTTMTGYMKTIADLERLDDDGGQSEVEGLLVGIARSLGLAPAAPEGSDE